MRAAEPIALRETVLHGRGEGVLRLLSDCSASAAPFAHRSQSPSVHHRRCGRVERRI